MRRRGFTLLELMTVVVIILILLGIGVAVGPAVMGGGEQAVTSMVMRNAQQLLDEYQTMTNDDLITTVAGGPSNPMTPFTTYTWLSRVSAVGSLQKKLVGFPSGTLAQCMNGSSVRTDGAGRPMVYLVDGWGNPIALVPASNTAAYTTTVDLNYDNTNDIILTQLPARNQLYFASAGPDAAWGDVRVTDPKNTAYVQKQDNVYSYSVK